MFLKAYLLLSNTEIILIKDYSPALSCYMFTVVTGCGGQMRARRRVQRKENVSEVSEGKLSHSGNVFTHTLFDYLVRISTDKITHLVCVGS